MNHQVFVSCTGSRHKTKKHQDTSQLHKRLDQTNLFNLYNEMATLMTPFSSSVMMLLLLCLAAVLSSVSAQTNPFITTGSINGVRTSMPTNADAYHVYYWAEYGIYLIVVFAIIIVIGFLSYLVTTFFLCFRLCGLCGGCKPKVSCPNRELSHILN